LIETHALKRQQQAVQKAGQVMADIFSKAKRSEVMALIRGRGNRATELALMRIFRAQGVTGWRRRQAVFGRPDFVFRRARVAVFVDGCFWHACPKHLRMPKSRRAYWRRKLDGNKARDQKVNRVLKKLGWRVVRIWEHALARPSAACLRGLRRALKPLPITNFKTPI
jgi:DNA mismatch endonuclease (patch repair protein)